MTYTPADVQLDGQHPLEVIDHALDFRGQIPTGDTLTGTPSVSVATGLTLTPSGRPAPTIVGTTVVFWLSGGTSGTTYQGEVRVGTDGGRTLVGNFQIEIVDPAADVTA